MYRRRRRAARPRKSREERLDEALTRGTRTEPNGNDVKVILELEARGVPVDEIDTFGPRQNVWTYDAWQAQGRHVRKGEKAVKLTVWIPLDDGAPARELDTDDGHGKPRGCRPVTSNVFHVSQTDPNEQTAATPASVPA